MSDFKHFRAGPDGHKRVAIYFLDDSTRFALGVVCAPSECTLAVLLCLAEVLRRWGRFGALYVDRGPGYISNDLADVCSTLNLPLVHGQARYPQAHGKIERFNRSTKARSFNHFLRDTVDPDCGSLTLRLRHDIFELYNHKGHKSLNMASPHDRFFSPDQPPLRPIDHDVLSDAFCLKATRRVSNDHVISFGGVNYEVPRGLRTQRITIWRHLLERDENDREVLSISHKGKRVKIHPVDVHFNAISGRAKISKEEITDANLPPCASQMSYERHLRPMTGVDGGYPQAKEK